MQRMLWCGAAALVLLGAVCMAVSGMRFSAFLCWAAAFALALYAALRRLAGKRPWARRCARAMLALFCAGLAFFLFLEARIVAGARGGGTDRDVRCVLVLGAGVDGTRPSLTLARRLEAALAYIADKPDVPVIVSGCRGAGEEISEAECMARWLIERGVERERVWKEEQASSTRTNFRFALALMAERGLEKTVPLAVVTSDYHIARARHIAAAEGVPRNSLTAVPSTLPDGAYFAVLTANYYVREAFAFANELLLGVDLDL